MRIKPGVAYLKLSRIEGSDTSTLETVDGEEVANFVGAPTRAFFENLGGTEVLKRHPNYLELTSTSPDGKTVRVTRFVRM